MLHHQPSVRRAWILPRGSIRPPQKSGVRDEEIGQSSHMDEPCVSLRFGFVDGHYTKEYRMSGQT